MGLESPVTYISDLVAANPTASDPRNEGDDHIRNVKTAVKNTFPNVSGAVTATHTELNYVDGVTSDLQTQLNAKAALASPTFTGTVTTAALTATGNVTLGDAGTDTVTTNGNVTINAPSSGGHTIAGALNLGVAGTEWDIDSSNRLLNSGNTQPKFRATRVTSSQTSGTTLIFNSVAVGVSGNHGSAYSTSTGLFTAPVDGYYFFSTSVSITNTSGSTISRAIDLYAVGVAIATSTTVSIANSGTGQFTVSGGCFMNADQTAYVSVNGGSLASNIVFDPATYSSFSGMLFC